MPARGDRSRLAWAPDPRAGPIMLDANALQGPPGQAQAMRRLLHLAAEGCLDLLLGPGVEAELRHPATPKEVRLKAQGLRAPQPRALTLEETHLLARVQSLLQGQGRAGRHAQDAANLVEAYRYGPYFVTNDKRILKLRDALGAVMPRLNVVRPSELLQVYDDWLARDEDWRT